MKTKVIGLLVLLLQAALFGQARIKDIAYFRGTQEEQLIGYGLVIGLAGTGDTHRATFTIQSVTSMLQRFGVTVPDINLRTRNVAAVMVTATISNQLKGGSQFDINVSSLGDATSLLGGQLLMTPVLSGKTGQLLAYAQGAIAVGGYDFQTPTGGRIAKNHVLQGRVPNGGILEDVVFPSNLSDQNQVSIVLREPDFTTADNIVQAINKLFKGAVSVDGSEIKVPVPPGENLIAFLAKLEKITVQTDAIAKVVLNERTGTIVAGSNVKILPVTISHGSLKITIRSFPLVSQPNPFSQGQTVVFNNLVPYVETTDSNMVVTIDPAASNVQQVATALTQLKVAPRDIIAIFQALKEAGALPAELVII